MKTLYLLRHSVTEYNSKHKMLGSTDIELSLEGYKLVENIKYSFSDKKIEGIVSSNLIRAVQTANILSEFMNVPLIMEPSLRERGQGELEGKEIKTIDNINFLTHIQGRESLSSFVQRIRNSFIEIVEKYDWNNFIIVSHNGVLRTFMALFLHQNVAVWKNCEYKVVKYDTNTKEWFLV